MIRPTSPTSHRFHGKALMLILVVSLSLLAACSSNAGSTATGGSSGSTQVSAVPAPTAGPLATAASLQITGATAGAGGDIKKIAVENGATLTFVVGGNPTEQQLSGPILLTVGILKFQGSWNNYLTPLLFLQLPQLMTLPIGMGFFKNQYSSDYAAQLVGAMMNAIPVLILFFSFSRVFTDTGSYAGLAGQ